MDLVYDYAGCVAALGQDGLPQALLTWMAIVGMQYGLLRWAMSRMVKKTIKAVEQKQLENEKSSEQAEASLAELDRLYNTTKFPFAIVAPIHLLCALAIVVEVNGCDVFWLPLIGRYVLLFIAVYIQTRLYSCKIVAACKNAVKTEEQV